MDGEIIGYSDRGSFSATLTDEVKNLLVQMNNNNSDNGSNDNPPDDSTNIITSGG